MERNVKTMHRYFDLLFGKNMDDLLNLFADDIDWFVVPTNTTVHGKGQFRTMAENHWSASPDRVKRMLNLFADDEYACQSPARAVEALRVEVARVMLEEGSHSVEEVADETGFGEHERMRRSFVRAYGRPPQAVRRDLRVVRR